MTDPTGDQHSLIDHFVAGFGGVFDAAQLTRLAEACERDDPRLIQYATVFPPVLPGNLDERWKKCCAVGMAAGGDTVADVWNAYFALVADRVNCAALPRDHPRWGFVLAWDALPRAQALAATAVACRLLLTGRADVGASN